MQSSVLEEMARKMDALQRAVEQLKTLQVPGLINLPVHASQAAAVAAGLAVGAFYRDGGNPDRVCVVH